MNGSRKHAKEIIDHHIKSLKAFNTLIKSVVLVGSLSDQSYTGNAGSDIDLNHILYDDAPQNARKTIRQQL